MNVRLPFTKIREVSVCNSGPIRLRLLSDYLMLLQLLNSALISQMQFFVKPQCSNYSEAETRSHAPAHFPVSVLALLTCIMQTLQFSENLPNTPHNDRLSRNKRGTSATTTETVASPIHGIAKVQCFGKNLDSNSTHSPQCSPAQQSR